MARKRKVVYLDENSLEQLDQMSGGERGDDSQVIAKAIDLLWKSQEGDLLVVAFDAELRKQFDVIASSNGMSPPDVVRSIVRRELTDKGVNQENIIRHIYVLVRIAVFLLIEIAKAHNVVFSPTPQEQIALRNGLNVDLDKHRGK